MYAICTLLRVIKWLIVHDSTHYHINIRILSNHWPSKLIMLMWLNLLLSFHYKLLTSVVLVTDKKTWKEIGSGLNRIVMGRSLLRIHWNVRSGSHHFSIEKTRSISIRNWLIQLIRSLYVCQKTSMLIFCDNSLVIAKSFRGSDLLLLVKTWTWNVVHFGYSGRTRIKCFKNVILCVKLSKRLVVVLDRCICLSYILFLISRTIIAVYCHLKLVFLRLQPYSLHIDFPVGIPWHLFNTLLSCHVETCWHAQLLFQWR